jgi:3-dehydroquinate dehydratase/shikimate dehydrogenase
MLCAVIRGPTLEGAQRQMESATPFATLFEWRLDTFPSLQLEDLHVWMRRSKMPFILTLRSKAHGGFFEGSETERLQQIETWAALKPAFLDIEYPVSETFIQSLRQQYPMIQLILSYHQEEPVPPAQLLERLKSIPVNFYKIANRAQSVLDPLTLLSMVREAKERNLIGVSMGEQGQISRILGPIFGNRWTYASSMEGEETAPGQLSARTLASTYHYLSLKASTAIYGLIGDPVDKSLSHLTHNAVIRALDLNAVYVKMPVRSSELDTFLTLVRTLGFAGLSVTMPLKESIVPYLDSMEGSAQGVGAVNTLVFEKDRLVGYNTDGKGALQALEEKLPIQNKKMVVIGAGGAAKAVAYEAHQQGCHVVILNRYAERAYGFAKELGCEAGGLERMQELYQEGYDILINSTPHPMPIDPEYLFPGCVVMDMATSLSPLPLLIKAQQKGCGTIPGYKMFIYQALGQFEIWFNHQKDQVELQKIKRILEDVIRKIATV